MELSPFLSAPLMYSEKALRVPPEQFQWGPRELPSLFCFQSSLQAMFLSTNLITLKVLMTLHQVWSANAPPSVQIFSWPLPIFQVLFSLLLRSPEPPMFAVTLHSLPPKPLLLGFTLCPAVPFLCSAAQRTY